MAGPYAFDRIRETSTTTGLGDFTLLGAVTGYRSFISAVSVHTFYYCIAHQTLSEWEVGLGVLSSGALVRSSVLMNSSGVASKINFSAGTKDVYVTVPAQTFQDYFFNIAPFGVPCNSTPTNGPITFETAVNGNGPGVFVFDDSLNELDWYQSTVKGYLKSDGASFTLASTAVDPVLADSVPGYDATDSTAKDFNVSRLLALINPEPGGRLTLLYGDPLPSADQTGGAAPSSTNTTTEIVTFAAAHGWSSGQGVSVSTTGGGLTAGQLYYFNAASTTTGSFHNTHADALAGTNKVNLTASITSVVVPAIDYQPLTGNTVVVYDGTRLVAHEIPAGLALVPDALTGANFDVFLYYNGSTLAFDAVAWSDNTTRLIQLTYQSGYLVMVGDTTRRYVGTYRTTSQARQVKDTEAARLLWNHYHRQPRKLKKVDTTDSWNDTAGTFGPANASTANRVEVVTGQPALLDLTILAAAVSTTGVLGLVGIDEDGTTANDGDICFYGHLTGATGLAVKLLKCPTVGYHFYQWIEFSVASGVTTWYGDSGGVLAQTGMVGFVMG